MSALPGPTEKEIMDAIEEYCLRRKCFIYRQNTGAFHWEDRAGKDHLQRFGRVGASDLVGCFPNGIFLAIEVKRPGKDPTPAQEEYLREVNERGVGLVAHDVLEVEAAFKKLPFDFFLKRKQK